MKYYYFCKKNLIPSHCGYKMGRFEVIFGKKTGPLGYSKNFKFNYTNYISNKFDIEAWRNWNEIFVQVFRDSSQNYSIFHYWFIFQLKM